MTGIVFQTVNANTNQEVDEYTPREIQIELSLKEHIRALEFLTHKSTSAQALLIYKELLSQDVLQEEIEWTEGMNSNSSPLHSLQFVVFKNYGTILHEEKEYEEALGYYEKASYIDCKDIQLWCKMGEIYQVTNDLYSAISCYFKGLQNSRDSSSYLSCYKGLVQCLYNVGYYTETLFYIHQMQSVHHLEWDRATDIKCTILKQVLDGFSKTTFLDPCISPLDLMNLHNKKFEIIPRRVQDVPREAERDVMDTQNVQQVIELELSHLTVLELVNLTLKAYSQFLLNQEFPSLGVPIHFSVCTTPSQDTEMGMEEEEDVQITGFIESETIDSTNSPKKRKKSIFNMIDAPRASDRFKQREEEQENLANRDLLVLLYSKVQVFFNVLQPNSSPCSLLDGKDRQVYFKSLLQRLGVNDSMSAKRAKLKRRRVVERFDSFQPLLLQPLVQQEFDTTPGLVVQEESLVKSLLSELNDSNLLEIMIKLFIYIVTDSDLITKYTDCVCALLKRIQIHSPGFLFLKNHFRNSNLDFFKALLNLAEIMYDGISVIHQEQNEWDVDTENPLTSSGQVSLFERIWGELHLLMTFNQVSMQDLSLEKTLWIRLLWLSARNQVRNNDLSKAIQNYQKCLLELQIPNPRYDQISLVSPYLQDSVISVDRVKTQLNNLKSRQAFLQLMDSFDETKPLSIVTVLDSFVSPRTLHVNHVNHGSIEGFESNERDKQESMKHYFEFELDLKRKLNLKRLYAKSLCNMNRIEDSIEQNILLIKDILQSITNFKDSIDDLLLMLSESLLEIIQFVSNPQSLDLKDVPLFDILNDECVLLLQFTLESTNNPIKDALSNLPKQLQEKRLKLVEGIFVEVWILFYQLYKRLYMDLQGSLNHEIQYPLTILSIGHEVLKESCMCASHKGSFLKLFIQEIQEILYSDPTIPSIYPIQDYKTLEKEWIACHACLYGIELNFLSLEPTLEQEWVFEDHKTTFLSFESTEMIFVLEKIDEYIMKQIQSRNWESITNQVRDSLNKITRVFTFKSNAMELNKSIVDGYLKLEVDANLIKSKSCMGVAPCLSRFFNSSYVTVKIHKMKALVCFAQFQTASLERQQEMFKHMSTESLNHLYMNPRDIDSWLIHQKSLLFQINQQLQDCNVGEFHKYKKNVSSLVKRVFLCLVQVSSLLKNKTNETLLVKSRRDVSSHVWKELGLICHLWISPLLQGKQSAPLTGGKQPIEPSLLLHKLSRIAKVSPQGILTLTDQVKHVCKTEKPNLALKKKQIAQLSVFCFRKAIVYDPYEWKYHYYLAKSYSKAESSPQSVIEAYKSAIFHSNSELGLKDEGLGFEERMQLLLPLVKLVTFLCKSLYWGRIDPHTVQNCISTILNPLFAKWSITGISCPNPNHETMQSTTTSVMSINDNERVSAFQMLSNCCQQLGLLDVNGFYPSLVYYHAWILYKIHLNVKNATSILSTLFSLNSKTWILIPKRALDSPGKHLISSTKYIELYIQLLAEMKCVDELQSLSHCIYKCGDAILNASLLRKSVYDSLFSVLESEIAHARTGLTVLVARISKQKFNQLASRIEQSLFQMYSNLDTRASLITCLLNLYDLKRTNDGLLSSVELDKALVDTYSLLFLEQLDFNDVPPVLTASLDYETVLKRCLICCKSPPWPKGVSVRAAVSREGSVTSDHPMGSTQMVSVSEQSTTMDSL